MDRALNKQTISDMIDVEQKKAKIIEVMKARGPVLPIQVAREIELSSLFTSAILSEMLSNKMIKVSNLKVGGSPLYLIRGQETMLENFSNYLGQKEKEVFLLLKEKGVLQDELLEPAQRVAIRSIRDFAVPLQVNINNENKIFWKFFSLSPEDSIKKIRGTAVKPKMRKEHEEKKVEKSLPNKSAQGSLLRESPAFEGIGDQKISSVEKKPREEAVEEKKEEKAAELGGKSDKKVAEKSTDDFYKNIQEYMEKNDAKMIEEIERKKKEIIGKVSVSSSIGRINMLLVAKDKKSVTENDLNLALNKGQNMKLPVLFLSTGEMNKKAKAEIETFKSYLIFKQLID